MDEGSFPYAVLISEPEKYRLPDVARVLARLRKMPVQDAFGALRRSWGVVETGFSEAAARETAAKLMEGGLPAVAIPENLIEDLPPLKAAAKMALSAEGVSFEIEAGRPSRAAWRRVALVAAAAFKQTTVRAAKVEEGPSLGQKALKLGLTLATGIPMGLGGGKKEVERKVESSDLVFYLDLVLREPAERLRIDAQDFDYSGLKAKMGYNASGNFRQLLLELTGGAKAAWANRGTQMLLDGKPVREMGYESLEDLERECRWLLTLRSLRPPA